MKSHFLTAVACRVFATGSSLICGLISLKLIGHHLVPEVYGAVLVAMQIIACLPLLDGGVRTVSNRLLLATMDKETRGRLLRFGTVFYSRLTPVVLGAAVLFMGIYATTPSGRAVPEPVAYWLAVGVSGALTMLGGSQAALLVGLGRQTLFFLVCGLSAWLSVIVLWAGLRGGVGIWSFPLATLAVSAGMMPLTIWLIRRCAPEYGWWGYRPDADYPVQLGELRTDAWACFRSQLATMLLFTLDVVLVGLICGATKEAAIYGVLARLFGMMRSMAQATSEVAWPLVARDTNGTRSLASFVLRANAWVYGATMGGMLLTVGPFLGWWMGTDWTPAPMMVGLLAMRFLITGLSAPAAYYLIGQGDYRTLARLVEREIVAALVVALAAGLAWGAAGVAGAFVFATSAGTLLPILARYAASVPLRPTRLAGQLWWRAILGLAVGIAVTVAMLPLAGRGANLLLVGALAAAAGLCTGGLIASARVAAQGGMELSHARFRAILRIF